ncbi:MAG TPA: hypothetical protein VHV47_01285 [Opitutaceae bacterium]|jgi:hypothetical protein|nr:hypothetical protein [Opitutaceae bacterium]
MPGEPEKRPLEAEDGDSNVSYRPARSVAPTDAKKKARPVSESELAGPDDARRAKILRSERYGPTSGKL